MLSTRVKAALIFVPLVLIMIYLGGWAFNLFIGAILLLAAFEFCRMYSHIGYRPSMLVLLIGILLLIAQRWVFKDQHLDTILSFIIFLATAAALIQYESGGKEVALNFAINLTGILYIGWVGSFFIPFRALEHGLGWMLTALPAVWLADSGAYFVGRRFGRHKLAPRLSPGKTWEGVGGAVVTGTLSGVLLILLWRAVGILPADTLLWQGAVMGLVLSLLTPVGDLLVSLIKRSAGVKDTGSLIPGHGGALDRIDTWIWAALLGYYLVLIFQSL